ncbi:MAG: MgtC/SapB family protein [Clostridia bacterium]|nr:MgtC/SapB family protein [Clostridia bacterium]
MSLTVECILRILLASFLGAAVGYERTKRMKEAGVRTHSIIAAASALLMIISKYGFADLAGADGTLFPGTRGADAARIAAQVVSGVSFLGIGVIFRNGNTVKGLTTAAGIWATSAVGMAIGAGMYVIGITLIAIVVCIQLLFHHFSIGSDAYSENDVNITAAATPEFKSWYQAAVEQKDFQTTAVRLDRDEAGKGAYTITFRVRRGITAPELISRLETAPDLISYAL